MIKCIRCGKKHEKNVKICDNCGFIFTEREKYYRHYYEGPKPEDMTDNQADLVEKPILSFIFGIIGLVLPGTFIFSILAIRIAPNPARSSLQYVQKMGKFLGYLGIIVSSLVIIILSYALINGLFG